MIHHKSFGLVGVLEQWPHLCTLWTTCWRLQFQTLTGLCCGSAACNPFQIQIEGIFGHQIFFSAVHCPCFYDSVDQFLVRFFVATLTRISTFLYFSQLRPCTSKSWSNAPFGRGEKFTSLPLFVAIYLLLCASVRQQLVSLVKFFHSGNEFCSAQLAGSWQTSRWKKDERKTRGQRRRAKSEEVWRSI